MSQSGLLIVSPEKEPSFIKDCLKCLENVMSGEANIVDNAYQAENGVKVYFNSISSAQNIFKQIKYLWVDGHRYQICPLTTKLVVQVGSKSSQEIETYVEAKLKQMMGKVINVTKILIPDLKISYSDRFKVEVDLAEIDAVKIFGNVNQMILPSLNEGKEYVVTFYCDACEKEGHLRFQCPIKVEPSIESSTEAVPRKLSPSGFWIRNREEELGRESLQRTAEIVGEEEVRRFAQGITPVSADRTKGFDDDVQIVSCQTSHFSAINSKRPSTDDLGQVSTSSSHVDAEQRPQAEVNEEMSSEDSFPATPPTRRRVRKPAKLLTVVIPERIKTIVDAMENNVMDSTSLEAFLNHVKKKSSPANVAREYTSNLEGFFRQLQNIKENYYKLRDMGTPKERSFMKDFGNLIARFHNKPKPRTSKKNLVKTE